MNPFNKIEKLVFWYKSPEKYSRYVSGRLEDRGKQGFVFIYKGGEIINPSFQNLYLLYLNKENKKHYRKI